MPLLREYLLASLDLEGAVDPIAVHAEASDAIALLGEHVPESAVAGDHPQALVTATEPEVTAPRVVVPVPRTSVAHFATLEQAINTALSMVEEGLFLTPPTQPEVQGLRSWLCAEVRRQAEGRAPTPWSPQAEPPRQVPHRLGWDVAPVRDAVTGLIAADSEDRIVAVSRPALDLLGYDEPGDLVGRRLVSIIPARYRQAHLAGFTMHFLTGRSTLLGRTVEVPALARDGSEVPILLTIGRERSDDGGTVFVASMDPADRD